MGFLTPVRSQDCSLVGKWQLGTSQWEVCALEGKQTPCPGRIFSRLLWKEAVSSLEIRIPFGKADQISADREFGRGWVLFVFAM